jgi:hypothetical protein
VTVIIMLMLSGSWSWSEKGLVVIINDSIYI